MRPENARGKPWAYFDGRDITQDNQIGEFQEIDASCVLEHINEAHSS